MLRIEMIYNLIPNGRICDVGTDHCKLAVMCVKTGKSETAVATDLRPGPLAAASRLIKKEKLEDRITTLISYGFDDIPNDLFDSIDTFVIAGMGGELIANIISRRHTDKTLVLQPMSAVFELCEFLCKNGYNIESRTFCREKDKMYTAMRVKYDGIIRPVDIFAGCADEPIFYEYLERELFRTDRAISGMKMSESPDSARLKELEELRGKIYERSLRRIQRDE